MSRCVVMHPAEQKRQTRKKLARVAAKLSWALDQVIAALDEIDGDPDLEPSLAAPEQPFYHWQAAVPWARGANDDCEHDDSDRELSGDETEPSLGSQEGRINQVHWGRSGSRDLEIDPDEDDELDDDPWHFVALEPGIDFDVK